MRISDWSSDVCSSDLQGSDFRSCRAAPAGRAHDVGECRHRLRAVQPQERRPDAATGADAALSAAVAPKELAVAGQWPRVPAKLSANELDCLALFGCRAGGVGGMGIDRKREVKGN